jgi:hypothetical protein
MSLVVSNTGLRWDTGFLRRAVIATGSLLPVAAQSQHDRLLPSEQDGALIPSKAPQTSPERRAIEATLAMDQPRTHRPSKKG